MFKYVTKCEQVDIFFKNILSTESCDINKGIKITNFLKCVNLHAYPHLLPNIVYWFDNYYKEILKYPELYGKLTDLLSVVFLYKEVDKTNFFDELSSEVKTNIFGILFIEYQVEILSEKYNNNIVVQNLVYILKKYSDELDICKIIYDNNSLDDFIILINTTELKNSNVCVDILHQMIYGNVSKYIQKDYLHKTLNANFTTKHKIASNPMMYSIYKKLIKRRKERNVRI